jgi:hypothetical protein
VVWTETPTTAPASPRPVDTLPVRDVISGGALQQNGSDAHRAQPVGEPVGDVQCVRVLGIVGVVRHQDAAHRIKRVRHRPVMPRVNRDSAGGRG